MSKSNPTNSNPKSRKWTPGQEKALAEIERINARARMYVAGAIETLKSGEYCNDVEFDEALQVLHDAQLIKQEVRRLQSQLPKCAKQTKLNLTVGRVSK